MLFMSPIVIRNFSCVNAFHTHTINYSSFKRILARNVERSTKALPIKTLVSKSYQILADIQIVREILWKYYHANKDKRKRFN